MTTVRIRSRHYTSAQIPFLHNFACRLGEMASNKKKDGIGKESKNIAKENTTNLHIGNYVMNIE